MANDSVRLIVFLGNPGEEYENTRHNIGFMTGDAAVSVFGAVPSWRSWEKTGLFLDCAVEGCRVFFLKPVTYMNLSGDAVQSFSSFYKIPPAEILVVYDDLALPFGKLRIRQNGSAGSHKGMASVINRVSRDGNIPRLRLGIGPRPAFIEGKDFVLSRFSGEENARMGDFLNKACEAIKVSVRNGIDKAMNGFNA